MGRKNKHSKPNQKSNCHLHDKLGVVNEEYACNAEFGDVYDMCEVVRMYNTLLNNYVKCMNEMQDLKQRYNLALSQYKNKELVYRNIKNQYNTLQKLVGRLALNATYYADIANKASKPTTIFTEQGNQIIMSGECTSIELEVEDA